MWAPCFFYILSFLAVPPGSSYILGQEDTFGARNLWIQTSAAPSRLYSHWHSFLQASSCPPVKWVTPQAGHVVRRPWDLRVFPFFPPKSRRRLLPVLLPVLRLQELKFFPRCTSKAPRGFSRVSASTLSPPRFPWAQTHTTVTTRQDSAPQGHLLCKPFTDPPRRVTPPAGACRRLSDMKSVAEGTGPRGGLRRGFGSEILVKPHSLLSRAPP